MVLNENSGEEKSERVKVRERDRGGFSTQTPSFFPLSPGACRTAPPTEGLEQARCNER